MKLLRLRLCLLVTLFALIGCASQGLRPGTGDVSFRLKWQGEADLDLHVVDPGGRHTGVVIPGHQPTPEELAALRRRDLAEQRGEKLPPGGVLDVDCNASPEKMCRRPIENVFWQPGTAPRGTFRFWALLFRQPVDGGEVPFELEVRRGEQVVESFTGVVREAREESSHYVFEY